MITDFSSFFKAFCEILYILVINIHKMYIYTLLLCIDGLTPNMDLYAFEKLNESL